MKFLFSPMGTHGFVFPAIGIAKELQRRGHEIAFVTSRSFSELLKREGLKRIPNGRRDRHSFKIQRWAEGRDVWGQVKHIDIGLEEFKPDALVGSLLGFGSIFSGKIHNLPTAVIGTSTYLMATPQILEHLESLNASERRSLYRSKDFCKTYNEVGGLFHIQPMSEEDFIADTPLLGDLFLLQNLPNLVDSLEELPQKVHLVGSCNWDTSFVDPDLENWLNQVKRSGEPVLYVQPGAQFNDFSFWPFLVDALAGRSIKIAASIGRKGANVNDLPSYPENFFVRDHVSQAQVIPYADGVVTEGRSTIVLGALAHGVPLMLVPEGGEEIECAEMCLRVGVCVGINPKDVSVKTMKETVDELILRKDIKENARRVGALFEKNNGHQNAADLIELLGRASCPIYRSDMQSDGA